MVTFFHRLSLASLMLFDPVELFQLISRDPYYHGGMIEWIGGLPLEPGTRLLELGCGPGALALEAARRRCKVTSLDRSERMAARVKKAAETQGLAVNACVGDACETGWPEGTFDLVIGASLLNVVGRPERLVREALRLLRPAGSVSFYFPNPGLNRAKALEFIRGDGLPASSAAILLTWAGKSPKLENEAALALFRAAGADDLQLRQHLGGMVSSVTGCRPKDCRFDG